MLRKVTIRPVADDPGDLRWEVLVDGEPLHGCVHAAEVDLSAGAVPRVRLILLAHVDVEDLPAEVVALLPEEPA